jgi:hypothetical protein
MPGQLHTAKTTRPAGYVQLARCISPANENKANRTHVYQRRRAAVCTTTTTPQFQKNTRRKERYEHVYSRVVDEFAGRPCMERERSSIGCVRTYVRGAQDYKCTGLQRVPARRNWRVDVVNHWLSRPPSQVETSPFFFLTKITQ